MKFLMREDGALRAPGNERWRLLLFIAFGIGISLLAWLLVWIDWAGNPAYGLLGSLVFVGSTVVLRFSKVQILSLLVMVIPFDRFELGPFSVSDWLLLVLLVRIGLDIWSSKEGFLHRSFFWWGTLLLTAGFLSWMLMEPESMFLQAEGVPTGLRTIISIFFMVMLAWSAYIVCREPTSIDRIAKAVMIGGTIAAIGGLIQVTAFYAFHIPLGPHVFIGYYSWGSLLRVTGFYFDPNFFALMLLAAILIGWMQWEHFHLGYRLAVLLMLFMFVATLSRTAWLMLALWLVTHLIQRMSSRLRFQALVVIVFVSVIIGPPLWDFFKEMSLPSYLAREATMESAIQMFLKKPLFGWGPGLAVSVRWNPANLALARSFPGGWMLYDGMISLSHNTVLQLLTQLGAIGTIAWLGIVLSPLWKSWRAYKSLSPVGKALLWALLFTLFASLFLDALLFKQTWLLLGMVAASTELPPARTGR